MSLSFTVHKSVLAQDYDEVCEYLEVHGYQTSGDGIVVYCNLKRLEKSGITFEKSVNFYYLRYITENNMAQGISAFLGGKYNNYPYFREYEVLVTGFGRERGLKQNVMDLCISFGATVTHIQTVDEIKARLLDHRRRFIVFVYQPYLLLKLMKALSDIESNELLYKCHSIYLLYYLSDLQQPQDAERIENVLENDFSRLQPLENTKVGMDSIPTEAESLRIKFVKLQPQEFNKLKYVAYRTHLKNRNDTWLFLDGFCQYVSINPKTFYDVVIPLWDSEWPYYKVLLNEIPVKKVVDPKVLFFSFPRQVILSVEGIETIPQLLETLSRKCKHIPYNSFSDKLENLMRRVTFVPASMFKDIPSVYYNRTFYVLMEQGQHPNIRQTSQHNIYEKEFVNLRNVLWLATVLIQSYKENSIIVQDEACQPRSEQLFQPKKLAPFVCELANQVAMIVFSYVNNYIERIRMENYNLDVTQIYNLIYEQSELQIQEQSTLQDALVECLHLNESLPVLNEITDYRQFFNNLLINEFNVTETAEELRGFENRGSIAIKEERLLSPQWHIFTNFTNDMSNDINASGPEHDERGELEDEQFRLDDM